MVHIPNLKNKLFLLALTLVLVGSSVAFAQKQIQGQVILEDGEGIKAKVYVNNSQFFDTDEEGRFSYICEEGVSKIRDVGVTKENHKFVKWEYDTNKNILITIKANQHKLHGRVFNEFREGYPYASVKITNLKDSVITDKQGAFVFEWEGAYKIGSKTRFTINGQEISAQKVNFFSNFSSVKILFIPAKKRNQTKSDELLDTSKEETDTLSKKLQAIIQEEEGIVPIENDLESGSEVDTITNLAKIDSGKYTPKENFDYIFNTLDYEKQILTETSVQIVSAMERITVRLADEHNLEVEEKQSLRMQLDLLEQAFLNNRLAFEGVQDKTRGVLEKMKQAYAEKDSLYSLSIEAKVNQEYSKNQINRLMMFGIFVFLGLATVSIIFYFLFLKREKEKNALKKALDEKEEQRSQIKFQAQEFEKLNVKMTETNSHLKNDLHYALAFQKAILPAQQLFSSIFNDYFILYRPKDVVSGDFYWFSHIPNTNKSIIAVADCIGQGVAGGFMSMVGVTLLNEALESKKITEPKEVLSWLNTTFRRTFPENKELGRLSIDMIICLIDRTDKGAIVTFSGANRPFYYINNQQGDIHRIKGDVKSIAGKQGEHREFTQTKLELESGDCIYLSTDGYFDQENDKNEKFGRQKFEALLEGNYILPMKGQQQLLEKRLDTFQNKTKQRDDIAIFGLKIP